MSAGLAVRRSGPDAGRLRARHVVADPHQGAGDLRLPAAGHAVRDLGRAPGHRPDAAAARPEPGRAVRPAAAAAGRRSSWRSRRTSSPRGVDKAGLRHRPGDLGDPGVHQLRDHPVRARWSRSSAMQTPLQLTDLPVARAAGPRDELDGRLRHRAGRLVVAARPTRCSAALRSSAQVISYEIAMGLSFVAGLPVRRVAVDLARSCRAGARNRVPLFGVGCTTRPGSRAAAAVVPDLPDHDGRRDQPAAVRPARGRGRAGRRATTPSTPR